MTKRFLDNIQVTGTAEVVYQTDGRSGGIIYTGSVTPTSPLDGDIWIDNSTNMTTGGNSNVTGNLSVSGSTTFLGPIYGGTGTFAKSLATGDIALDNNSTDTPGILFYNAANTNWGIDSFFNGTDQVLRFVKNLNESGGSEKARIDGSGNFIVSGSVGATNISDSGWINVSSFTNSFVSAGTAPAYRKLNGVVYLRGNVQSGTAGTAAFTLPSGYRPSVSGTYSIQQYGTANMNYITVDTAGNVTPNATSAWLSGVAIPIG
jgi:hypothetical protein